MEETKIETEFETKQKQFLEKYGELVKETGIDFAAYPVYIPDGQGHFKTIIQSTPVDVSKQGLKSPFIEQST